MSNEQLIVYLMSLLDNLNVSILQVMADLPDDLKVTSGSRGNIFFPERETFPVLSPILEVKESLYEQIEVLKGGNHEKT